MSKLIFIDTNILIHFKFFDEIKWNEIINYKTAKLMITSTVLNELENLKYDSNSKKRERARKVIKKLDELITDSSQSAKLNEHVYIQIINEEPKNNLFTELNLDPQINDHRLIATIIEFTKNNPTEEVILISNDFSLRLTSKKNSIDVLQLPEEYELVPEKDEKDKKIENLSKQINTLKNTYPNVIIAFENQFNVAEFCLCIPKLQYLDTDLISSMEAIKNKYPKQKYEVSPNISNTLFLGALTKENIDNYNKDLEKYYSAYEEYLKYYYKSEDLRSFAIQIILFVYNNGFAPAENIEIFFHFPDGFELLTEKEMNQKLIEPTPPKLNTPFSSFFDPSLVMHRVHIPDSSSVAPNVSKFRIYKSNSYDVKISIRNLKHNHNIKLDSLYVIFDSFESASSFSVDYIIQADNIPFEQRGNLRVVITKVSRNE